MKKSRLILTSVSILLICSIALSFSSCTTIRAEDLMKGITPNKINVLEDTSAGDLASTDLAVRLLQAANKDGQSILLSPISILYALSMTANGAKAQTLAQMEDVLGMTTEELNLYLYSYMRSIPDIDRYTLSIANSIWFTNENFNVNQDFLQTNADYYAADIYKTKFDKRAVKDVNSWVNKKTDGMIKDLIDEFDPATVMCLVNALAFEAEWSEPYQKGDVNDEKFTKEDGTKQDAELMYSTESSYISDENSSGFIKHYSGNRFAFAAILPNEDISVSEYINSLDGASLSDMLSNAKNATVRTSLPKFEFEYGVKLNDVLKTMGMTDAFDPKSSDFSGISSDNGLYIGKVMHKTYIQVAEKGTRAGVATSVEMLNGSAEPEEIYEVYLNRPFIYMLIDLQSNTPLFIGTVMEITN